MSKVFEITDGNGEIVYAGIDVATPEALTAQEEERESVKADRRIYLSAFPTNRTAWCGHKIDTTRKYDGNCTSCWGFWFVSNVEFTKAGQIALEAGEEKAMTAAQGKKLVKHLKKFVHFAKQAHAAQQYLDSQKVISQTEVFEHGSDIVNAEFAN